LDLRTNPFQGGGDDVRGPNTSFHERQPQERLGQGQERLGQERLGPRQERLGQGQERDGIS